jgi:MoxR-like ATPase
MRKEPVGVNVPELKEILENYLDAGAPINYAVKIVGHPGIGKSDVVRQTAAGRNFLFIDTRLAFKENIDLGGYPVPDHEAKRMIYYRPGFIPPDRVPEGFDGILWFLDEANRAHPTVIQTLFQIITEKICGEHRLPDKTFIVLAGNLGESDGTTITQFDDAALDGRLAVFHLKPDAQNWLRWAQKERIHPSVMRYISQYPERLWDERHIHPNPRGWHQVSQALRLSYNLHTHDELITYLSSHPASSLEKLMSALIGRVACDDFILQLTCSRQLSTQEILKGDPDRLAAVKNDRISPEDILWALTGALETLRNMNAAAGSDLGPPDLRILANIMSFIGHLRADMRLSFVFQLIKQCAVFTQIPPALRLLEDRNLAARINDQILEMLESQ